MKVHGKRSLLNRPGYNSTAAIVAEIEDTETWPDGKNGEGVEITTRWGAQPSATLRISDCDRAVSLDLDFDTAEDWRNTLYKVDTMIDALVQMRNGLLTERERYMQRVRGIKK